MRNRTHMGINFEVWNGGQAWFWLVAHPHSGRSAIGAVADESGAVREACSSIEEMSARGEIAPARRSPLSFPPFGWRQLLTSLDRYLTRACVEIA